VLGGGAIGCELSQVAARFGTSVTVVERAPRLLVVEEPRAGDVLAEVFAGEGIDVRVGVGATAVEPNGTAGAVRLRLEDGAELTADRLLVASGRRVDLHAVGLDTLGIDADARAVPVDEWCRVGDRVWAIGDIVGHGAFTHMSMYEADIVVRDVLGQGGAPGRFDAIPRVTFTDPEVGAVGLTEAQARERYAAVATASADVADTTRGWIHGPGNAGFISVVQDVERDVLVGATSAGPTGGEVLGFLALAVTQAVPVQAMIDMPYAYPTVHRGIQAVLQQLR
jgi:pyruvate/2-oxoglutarate dehydrogenase complex dihydrolipoamide dehydrogenase (E3) component